MKDKELTLIMDELNKISYKTDVKSSGPPKDYRAWLKYWDIYENLLVSHYGLDIYRELSLYKNHIAECEKVYKWSSVVQYDVKHRSALGGRSLCFSKIDPVLYVTTFDFRALRVDIAKCKSCGGMDHVTDKCPFPTPPPYWKDSQTNLLRI